MGILTSRRLLYVSGFILNGRASVWSDMGGESASGRGAGGNRKNEDGGWVMYTDGAEAVAEGTRNMLQTDTAD